MTKMIRLAFLALLLALPAQAEEFANSGNRSQTASGVVLLCRTAGSLYLPCDATTPLATTGGGGGGGGGTSSTYGAAFPTTGTAIGLSDGTNMVAQFSASNLADNVTGANMGAMGSWVWSGSGWYRFPGSNLGVKVVGSIASGSAKSGFPVQTGAVFNTTQPTVTTGQIVESQATARGAHIVATGTDAFNVTDVTTAASVSSTLIPNNTTAIVVKGSAGTLYGITAFNNSATIAYIKVYNATSATAGSGTPLARFMIPANTAGTGLAFQLPLGVAYSTGITYVVTTGIADNDTTAPAASAYIVNVHYK
jgi:hypothetical protein